LLNLLILLLLVVVVGFEPTTNRANRFALPTELKLRALNLLLLFGVADSICDDYEGALLRWQLPPPTPTNINVDGSGTGFIGSIA
jgi:hypothetical protein